MDRSSATAANPATAFYRVLRSAAGSGHNRTMFVSFDLINLAGSVPEFPHEISIPSAAAHIINQRPEGYTMSEVETIYSKYCGQMGAELATNWKDTLRQILSRHEAKVNANTEKLTLTKRGKTLLTPSLLPFFGIEMKAHVEHAKATRDDIETRPELMIIPARWNGPTYLQQSTQQLAELNLEALDTFGYWKSVHNGRPPSNPPIQIHSCKDMSMSSKHVWHYHVYAMSRSKVARLFNADDGKPTKEDLAVLAMLKQKNLEAKAQEKRILVTFLLRGVSAWSTDFESLIKLATTYSHLEIRLTVLMPASRVSDTHLAAAFSPRSNGDPHEKVFAWAHFDITTIADIHSQVKDDSKTAVQFQRQDQYVLRWILEELKHWKDDHDEIGTAFEGS